jgi:hypothetical protein
MKNRSKSHKKNSSVKFKRKKRVIDYMQSKEYYNGLNEMENASDEILKRLRSIQSL